MMRTLWFICGLLWSGCLSAQVALEVMVRDAHSDRPVSNAHLKLISAFDSSFTISDAQGQALLKVPQKDALLSLSHVAYQNRKIALSAGQKELRLFLEPKSDDLSEVVVTGQTAPTLARKSVKSIRVIGRDRIEKQAAVNLRDLLSNELNFQVSEDPVLGTQLNLAGMSGSQIKILIDGVPVIGRLDGNIDLSQINLNNVDRVEIVEGPMSVQYGTDAVAGTINLITSRRASADLEGRVNAYYETVGRYNFDVGLRLPLFKHWHSQLSLGRNDFEGWHPEDGERNLQWNPKEQYFANLQVQRRFDRWLLRYQGEFFDEEIQNAGAVGSFDSALVPVDSGAWKYPQALDDLYFTRRVNNSLNAQYYFKNGARLKGFVAYNYFRRIKRSEIVNLHNGERQLFVGTDAQDTSVFGLLASRAFYSRKWLTKLSSQIGYDLNYEFNRGERLARGERSITDAALFTTLTYQPTEALEIEPGLRYAYNSRYSAPLISSLALRWQLADQWTYRFSYGQGFRAPSLKELYFLFVDENHNILGNENLEAETSHNFQTGLSYFHTGKRSSFEIELKGFFNDLRNEIRLIAVVDPSDSDPRGLFRNENVARSQNAGASLSGRWVRGALKAEAGLSYLGIKNSLAFSSETPQDFNFFPQARLNLSYEIKPWGLSPSLFLNYQGAREDLSLNAEGNLSQTRFSDFVMSDFTLQKQIKEKWRLSLGVKNLFNITNLQASQSIGGGAHSAGSRSVPLGYGRSYFGQINYQF